MFSQLSFFNHDSKVIPGEDDEEPGNVAGNASNGGYDRIESKEEDDEQNYNLFSSTGESLPERQISLEKKIVLKEVYLKQCIEAQEILKKELIHLRKDKLNNSYLLQCLLRTPVQTEEEARNEDARNENETGYFSILTQYIPSFFISKKQPHVITLVAQDILVANKPLLRGEHDVKKAVRQKKFVPPSIMSLYKKDIDISNQIFQIENRRLDLESEIQFSKKQLQILENAKQEIDARNDIPWISLLRSPI